MLPLRIPLAVTFARTPLVNRWLSERWEPVEAEVETTGAPASAVKVCDDASGTRWRFGGLNVELHPSEAEGYFLNVTTAAPKVFVMWRRAEAGIEPAVFPVIVTLSYNQAARMLDGGETVDAVPIPPALLAVTEQFAARHYKGEPRRKLRRNDPIPVDGTRRDRESRQ